jgi:hypothetical protein
MLLVKLPGILPVMLLPVMPLVMLLMLAKTGHTA